MKEIDIYNIDEMLSQKDSFIKVEYIDIVNDKVKNVNSKKNLRRETPIGRYVIYKDTRHFELSNITKIFYYLIDFKSKVVYKIDCLDRNSCFFKDLYEEIKLIVEIANMSKEEVEEFKENKKQSELESEKLLITFKGDNKLITPKQVYYIADLLDILYNVCLKTIDLPQSQNIINAAYYNDFFDQYYLETTDNFKVIDTHKEIGAIIQLLNELIVDIQWLSNSFINTNAKRVDDKILKLNKYFKF